MFSIVDAVLLKPLPFPHPERMVRVWESTPEGRNGTTTLTFLDWKRQSDVFEALSVESPTRAATVVGGDPARVAGKLVSADYFQVFGIKPQIGRSFVRGEDQPGAAPVVVLSHAFWQARFASDPNVLNRSLMLDGEDKPLRPAELEVLGSRDAWLTISEGRYHQVRRMFAAVGNHVEALHRSRVGGLELGDLAPGQWRVLGDEDLQRLFEAGSS